MPYDPDDELQDGESLRVYLVDTFPVDADLRHHQPGYRLGDAASKSENVSVSNLDAARDVARAARTAWIADMQEKWRGPQRDANPPQFTCPECHGTGKDPDGDSDDDECDMCGGTGSIPPPNRLSSSQRRDPGRYPDGSLKVDARANDARRAAYYEYCKRLTEAYRTKDASQPNTGSSLAEIRAHERGEPPENAMLRRHLSTEASAGAQAKRDAAWNAYRDRISRAYLQGRTDPRAATQIERQGERWRGGR
jgi:hypothetical protein